MTNFTIPFIASTIRAHYFTDSISDFLLDSIDLLPADLTTPRDALDAALHIDIADLIHNDPDAILPPTDNDDFDIRALDYLIDNIDPIIHTLIDMTLS